MTLHYSSVEFLPNNKKSLKWVQMKLHSDFKKTLKKLGCLPVRRMEEIVNIQLENVDLEGELEFAKYIQAGKSTIKGIRDNKSTFGEHPDFQKYLQERTSQIGNRQSIRTGVSIKHRASTICQAIDDQRLATEENLKLKSQVSQMQNEI